MTTPFFRSCFHPSRLAGGICLVDLVRSWARHHPAEDVERAVEQIGGLLGGDFGDDRLRILVLGAAGCGYDPGMHGFGMAHWLGLVRDLLLGRSDLGLPDGAWEPLAPWPGQDVGPFPALRHLLTAYFHDNWRAHASSYERVVERYVADEGPRGATELVEDIDDLLDFRLGEERLRILVLGRWRSAYDPRPDLPGGQTMGQWLRSVRGVVVSVTVSAEPV